MTLYPNFRDLNLNHYSQLEINALHLDELLRICTRVVDEVEREIPRILTSKQAMNNIYTTIKQGALITPPIASDGYLILTPNTTLNHSDKTSEIPYNLPGVSSCLFVEGFREICTPNFSNGNVIPNTNDNNPYLIDRMVGLSNHLNAVARHGSSGLKHPVLTSMVKLCLFDPSNSYWLPNHRAILTLMMYTDQIVSPVFECCGYKPFFQNCDGKEIDNIFNISLFRPTTIPFHYCT